VKNPLTGEVSEGEGTYEYEVGERSATVSADKMNVFYIGVDNPISVSASRCFFSNDLKVSISGGGPFNSQKDRLAKYAVTSYKPG
jgi:hypothetical protein